jgi:hypothetical protein
MISLAISQMPFPLTTMKTLNEEDCKKLVALKITEVQAFVSRTIDPIGTDNLRKYLGWTHDQMNSAIAEARSICPTHPVQHQFAMGALIPPGMEWQEGKTAGEIALIQFAIRTLLHLHNEARPPAMVQPENGKLQQEAKDLLTWYGVPLPELR